MKLYHFTAAECLRGIAQEGLTVGDVPTDIVKMRGQIGVWLTSATESDGHGLTGARIDKKRCRIEIEIADNAPLLVRWSEWSPTNVTLATRRLLTLTAADEVGRDRSDTWWIYLGWIRRDSIVGVTDMTTGEKIEDWTTFHPEHLSLAAVPFRRKENWQKRMLKDVRSAAAELTM